MKFPPLDYVRPPTLGEAIGVLAGDEDAKVLAGGQSLMPLLALRLARPTVLVDLAETGLDGVDIGPGGVTLGAFVRQRRLELAADLGRAVPLLAAAARQVGYASTRNRGTIGGSLAHADPVAELPTVAVALGASVVATGPAGARTIACADLPTGYFSTVLEPDEVLTEVRFPARAERHGAAWHEWSPRAHDFALAGAGIAVDLDRAGTCVAVHAAACGAGGTPLPLGEVMVAAGAVGWAPRPDAGAPASLLRAVAIQVTEAAVVAGAESDPAELA
ncbi:MAG TPA: FAD binding domain-containing protein, partial [Acidimicrobiales bacterium]